MVLMNGTTDGVGLASRLHGCCLGMLGSAAESVHLKTSMDSSFR